MKKMLKNSMLFKPGIIYNLRDIYQIILLNGGFTSNNNFIDEHRVRSALAVLKKSKQINHLGKAKYILN